jgi:Holliday junction resolvase RusA-like endonuclease
MMVSGGTGRERATTAGAGPSAPPSMVLVEIPGEPVAQGRPRLAVLNGHARAYDPAKSRVWKGVAQMFMRDAMRGRAPMQGALEVEISATWSCPVSATKRAGAVRRLRAKKPDAENVAKAILDAGNGVVWGDDAQVAVLIVRKWTGARGEAPGVAVRVVAIGTAVGS